MSAFAYVIAHTLSSL